MLNKTDELLDLKSFTTHRYSHTLPKDIVTYLDYEYSKNPPDCIKIAAIYKLKKEQSAWRFLNGHWREYFKLAPLYKIVVETKRIINGQTYISLYNYEFGFKRNFRSVNGFTLKFSDREIVCIQNQSYARHMIDLCRDKYNELHLTSIWNNLETNYGSFCETGKILEDKQDQE